VFACLGRLGCLFLILVLGAIAWLTREQWQPRVFGDRGSPTITWEPLTDAGATRAREGVASLRRSGGPAYVALSAAEVASLLVAESGYGLPASLDSVMAAIEDDRVRIRARVPLDAIRGLDALGPLSDVLGRTESIEMGGTLAVLRPGLAEFRVRAVSVADLSLPQAVIPRLLARLDSRPRPDGVAPDGIAISIPDHIGDVRVARGEVTLYRGAP
jgi:hypothetical protein